MLAMETSTSHPASVHPTAVQCSENFLQFAVSRANQRCRLYVGSLHFNLTEADIKQVFEPFGELEFVDLHRDPTTGRSKGYAFVQYKHAEDARMAMEQMEGFELAGRQVSISIELADRVLTLCIA